MLVVESKRYIKDVQAKQFEKTYVRAKRSKRQDDKTYHEFQVGFSRERCELD